MSDSKRSISIITVAVALGFARAASGGNEPTMHEPISVDARDDLAMGVVLGGDIPAAIETRSGVFSAPDPTKVPTRDELKASSGALNDAMQGAVGDKYTPDRDTRRPDVLRYVDPFTPSNAPFKRLVAFDAVDASFALFTRDGSLRSLGVDAGGPLAGEDVFYADVPVEVGPDRHARIPSVGPGARVLHAHLGAASRDLYVDLKHDGADNWFIDSGEHASARLVMELAIPRTAFGGDIGDPDWSTLGVPIVPEDVMSAAHGVMVHIGVGRTLRPAENVRRMVAYFRAFVDSDRPLEASRDVYTDLAMSQKGVCRHRAYAFTITALALGIPTRMVMNEAHAWVEVWGGSMWKRIDLGGAGRMLSEESRTAEPYAAPRDAFPWPANATRGDDMVEKASNVNGGGGGGSGTGNGGGSTPAPSASATTAEVPSETSGDKRPQAKVTLEVNETAALRGTAVHVKGRVSADGDACGNAVVAVLLRDPKSKREARVGSATADDKGVYSASIVLPSTVPLGDYEVVARSEGDVHCGRGVSQ
jgi:Transglutaminase-like superfamily